jgi:hypothetical protein
MELGTLSDTEAIREGFSGWLEFYEAWKRINGSYDSGVLVWRVGFKLVDKSTRPVGQVNG